MKFLWKNCKTWLLVTSILLVLMLVITIVATQHTVVYGTFNTLLGGERRVLVEGDPSKYLYYQADNNDFIYYKSGLDYTGASIFDFGSARSKKAKTDTAAEAGKFNEKIVEEGIVLLKNEYIDGAKTVRALPLKTNTENKSKISVFGKNSVDLVYGGSGSGEGNTSDAKTIYQSLEAAGYEVNPSLKVFYESKASGAGRKQSKKPEMGDKLEGLSTGETPQSSYTDAVKSSYNEYNKAAIIVISRIGGEGFDLPRTMKGINGTNPEDHYLQLDNNERALIKSVCDSSFERVIIVINSSTSMELGFLDDITAKDKNGVALEGYDNIKYDIDAALWLGSPGKTGIMALGRVLNGEVNPSGRLVDTYARNFKSDPTWQNFGFNGIAGNANTPVGNEYISGGKGAQQYFVDYEEGIYLGYRYYETRAYARLEYSDNLWYSNNVVYPFGYGKSYTDFSWEILNDGTTPSGEVLAKDGKINVKVRVKNNGAVSGKDVIQLYFTAPFDGYIEKSRVVLGDFIKTDELNPGESKEYSLTLNVKDMASYDYSSSSIKIRNKSCYKLESGRYYITIAENAHQAMLNSESGLGGNTSLRLSYTVPNDNGGFTYDEDVEAGGKVLTAAKNRFDEESNYIKDRLISRSDFEATLPKTSTTADRTVSAAFIDSLKYNVNDKETDPWYVPESERPTQGRNPGKDEEAYNLYNLIQHDSNDKVIRDENGVISVDYNDKRWNNILDRLTINEMAFLIGTGNFNTAYIDKIGKPKTTDPDGPAGFTNFMGDPTVYETGHYASECVIASAWNKALAHDMGVMIGLEGIWGNQRGDGRSYSGWYAPAVNIHRSPFSGRNFEYYSEDPVLSGIMGANVVIGASKKGVYTYIKHFALNDQETDRGGICTWADEQTMREIYLKPFEIIVKTGKTSAIMSSFNRIGTVWTGGDYRLITEVLRDEWGFRGMVISDYNTYSHMPADQMIRAGGDLNLYQGKLPSINQEALTATQVTAMRNATKNILYTVARSNAMNGMGDGVVWRYAMPVWEIILIISDIIIGAGLAVWGFFNIRGALKKQKTV